MSSGKRNSNNPSGRPLSHEVTERIYAAVFQLIAQGSYQSVSMDAVAAAAGVSRPALYRRYSGVGPLTLSALQAVGGDVLPMAYSSDAGRDIADYLKLLAEVLSEESVIGQALRGALASALVDPKLGREFAQFIEIRRVPVRDRLLEWDASLSPKQLDAILDSLFGPVLYRLLIRGVPIDEGQVGEIVGRSLGKW